MKKSKTYRKIEVKCAEKGISIAELCRMSGIDEMVVYQWKSREPQPIVRFNKLMDKLDKINV